MVSKLKLGREQVDGLSRELEHKLEHKMVEKWIQNKLTFGHNIGSRTWQDDCVRNKLTSHSIESVGQPVGV